MCRHAAYLGPPIHATGLLQDLSHGLVHQSYAARELLTGTVCADGYGVGWYDDGARDGAARYSYPGPIWSDPNLDQTLPFVRSGLFVAAVRNASIAGSNTHANCAPFRDGPFLFSLNGFLDAWPTAWREPMNDWLPDERRERVRGDTDGEHLFACLLARLDELGGDPADLATATQSLVRDVLGHAEGEGVDVYLNLLISDGKQVVATRAGSKPTQNSLYLLQDGDEFPGATVLASEPLYDDPHWEVVEPDTVLAVQEGAPPVRLRA